jgi:L-ascorbate metabolism protein UlaG (beta-lactamase superfamily)
LAGAFPQAARKPTRTTIEKICKVRSFTAFMILRISGFVAPVEPGARPNGLRRPIAHGSIASAQGKSRSQPMRSFFTTIAAACVMLAAPVFGQSAPRRQPQTFPTAAGPVVITPVYHACALIQAGGKNIYIDPARPANFTGLPKADLILITHAHSDHMDPVSIAELSKADTEILAPVAVAKVITQARVITNGETTTWGAWKIHAVPMYNIKRGPAPGKLYHPKGWGNGYVLTYGGKRFYFSGDTENIPEMRALKNIDVAFICMNLPYTMTPLEAAAAVKAFHPRVAIPYHYRGSDPRIFKKALAGTGIEVRLLDWYPKTK